MAWGHRHRSQSGLNSLQVILLLLLAAAVYGAVKFGPPYIRNYQLANAFDDEARRAHLVGDAEIRENILRKARDIGGEFADWDGSEIKITRNEQERTILVSAAYEVPVELFWGQVVTLRFAPEVDRPIERR